jgi:predicted hotdog family 3-hydroxylacyl-ACP dehydratase
MSLNRAWIAQRIPHRGRMCLLDEVLSWDTQHIECRASTHRAPDHPLQHAGTLGVACGIEYAAQAMALHGALMAGAAAGPAAGAAQHEAGFLAGVREVHMSVARLDDIEADLFCGVTLLAGGAETALYEFIVRADERLLLNGRATVIIDGNKRLKP